MAETSSANSLLTLFATILGFATSQLSEWLKERRGHARDAETRKEARRDKRLEEQNRVIIRLSETLHQLLRAVSSAHTSDSRAYAGRTHWSFNDRHPTVKKVYGLNAAKTSLLMMQVRDKNLRSLAEQIKVQAGRVMEATTSKDSNEGMNEAIDLFSRFMDLGNQLLTPEID